MKRLICIFTTLVSTNIVVHSLPCPNLCNAHGHCAVYSNCACNLGYDGADCSIRKCPTHASWAGMATSDGVAHAHATCSNMGLCDTIKGTCECFEGFEGRTCQRNKCPNQCSGNGRCMSMYNIARWHKFTYSHWDKHMIYGCLCDEGYEGHDCSLQKCPTGDDPLTLTDAKTGKPQMNEVQYVAVAAKGTMAEVDKSGSGTYFTLTFRGHTTSHITCDDTPNSVKVKLEALPSISSVNVETLVKWSTGRVNSNGDPHLTSVCGYWDTGKRFPQYLRIEFLQEFGDLPPLTVPYSARFGLLSQSKSIDAVRVACTTDDPNFRCTQLTNSKLPQTSFNSDGNSQTYDTTSVKGTRENAVCSNRGLCNYETGQCECSYNFASSDGIQNKDGGQKGNRGDCGYKMGPIVKCPGEEIECSGHGVCAGDPTYKCTCDAGWGAGDCSERLCPSGRAWIDVPTSNNVAHQEAVCSNAGSCDKRTGKCICQDGFTGEACERTKCPTALRGELTLGAEWLDPTRECNGNGRCLPMESLAEFQSSNGVPTPFTYGAIPNNVANWDYRTLYGCYCDEGYTGPDCSLRTCPKGDNPDTPGLPEIQEFNCTVTKPTKNPTFTFSFRKCVTDPIKYDTTLTAFEKILEATECITNVTVNFMIKGKPSLNVADLKKPICGNTKHTVRVTFNREHGDLPQALVKEIVIGSDAGLILENSTIQDATTENVVCSDRGLCDYTVGECVCLVGWGSSDGYGNKGPEQDCGYRLPTYGKNFAGFLPEDDGERLRKMQTMLGMKLFEKYNQRLPRVKYEYRTT